jgi:N-ethylmaleimide reductase
MYSPEQTAGWKLVTSAVHAKGAKIFVQLMHCGRIAHPLNMPQWARILAPSALAAAGQMWTDAQGMQPQPVPEAMTEADLKHAVEEYVLSAKNAIAAGFDGVELHAANGYLLHQFLSSNTNLRTDGYGDDVAGRIRFVVETVDAVADAIGERNVAIRLSPGHEFNGIEEADPEATYDALLRALAPRDLMYVHVMETEPFTGYSSLEQARRLFPGTLMANAGFTEEFDVEGADDLIADGRIDLVAYGRRFLANPDLPRRLAEGAPLNEPVRETFYGGGAEGYTDYPALDAAAV